MTAKNRRKLIILALITIFLIISLMIVLNGRFPYAKFSTGKT